MGTARLGLPEATHCVLFDTAADIAGDGVHLSPGRGARALAGLAGLPLVRVVRLAVAGTDDISRARRMEQLLSVG